jgi:hypothetical protein
MNSRFERPLRPLESSEDRPEGKTIHKSGRGQGTQHTTHHTLTNLFIIQAFFERQLQRRP